MTHEVVKRLDREDTRLLSSDLDDVIDRIDAIARRAEIFRLGVTTQGIRDLCDVLRQITAEIAMAMARLKARDHVIDHCTRPSGWRK